MVSIRCALNGEKLMGASGEGEGTPAPDYNF
jgi:hypothetical protein